MKDKKRLGICVFYDSQGIVDLYVEELLRSMSAMLSRLIIVINGTVTDMSRKRLDKFASGIYIRENTGYDGGAYRDLFYVYLKEEDWNVWDEIVLFNTTFYGPFYPVMELWDRMDQTEADFWGVTRHPGGEFAAKDKFPAHIQSYFIVVRKRLLEAPCFLQFWEGVSPAEKRRSRVVNNFEVRFTSYFEEKGFLGAARTDLKDAGIAYRYNECPYSCRSYELIANRVSPFLKRTCLMIENRGYANALRAYGFLKNLQYSRELIRDNIHRLCVNDCWNSAWNYVKLEQFYYGHAKIYIYGTGQNGKALRAYFLFRGWTYEAFLVSDGLDLESGTKYFSDITFSSGDGVILALAEKNIEQVIEQVRIVLSSGQIYIPAYEREKNE